MRVISGSNTPPLAGAAILALILGCGNPANANTANGDEIRFTVVNHGAVEITVNVKGPANSNAGFTIAPGASESHESDGGTGDYLKFTVTTSTISPHIKQCQAGAPIVSVGGNAPPNSLYGQVDVNVHATSIDIDCTGGLGEWM